MRTHALLAVSLVVAGGSAVAPAQQGLPSDWDKKVSAVVAEPMRAERVTEGGRRFDARRLASLEAMKAANAEMRSVFLNQAATEGNRRLSLNVLRDDRRKATLAAVDTLLEMRGLVSQKEWKAIWPEGYFAMPIPGQLLALKVQEALPAVVPDPARLKQAQDVAAGLVAAAKSDEAARRKSSGKFTSLLERYESERDEFIDLVNDLEKTQAKADAALIDGGGKLQKVLSPEEWSALVSRVTPAGS